MTDDRSLERAARSWLETGPTQAPDRAVEAALLRIKTTPQERDLRIPWRLPKMLTPARVAAAAIIGVLAIGGAFFYLGKPSQPAVGGPQPSPSGTPAASPTASASRSLDATGLQGWIVFHHGGTGPDGSTTAAGRSDRGLWLVHADGSGLHELAPGIPASGKVSQDISPDGTHVAFGSFDLPVQIWQVAIEGGDPELLTTDCSGQPSECMDGAPTYSSDGSRVAFVRSTEASSVLAILDLSSGAITTLDATRVASSVIWLSEPSWSPDDRQIVYHDVHRDDAQDKNVDSSIFIIDADGTGLHELDVLDGTPVGDADWSPDGSRIVFSSYPIRDFNDTRATVYSVDPDGTDLLKMTPSNVGYGAPSWTPDGSQIMYWGPVTFHVMDPDGSNARPINNSKLTFDDGFGYYAYLQPTP